MKRINLKIRELFSNAVDWMEYGLRRLYGKPSMMKQFIIVVILGSVLSVFSIYSVVSSIYNIGRMDAQKEFMDIKHAGHLELPSSGDSIPVRN